MSFIIPLYKPYLGKEEQHNVNKCLQSTWISSKGEYINLFEKEFAKYLDVEFATTVTNGTVALHLALHVLGIGENDEVIVPTLTYIASVNAIKYVGAKPVFIDSNTKTWNIETKNIVSRISKKTKAILPVHLYGNPCEMNEINKIAEKYNLFIIEDAAEAFGSMHNQKQMGSFGDIATFSFFGNKTITTGEGGMITTNNEDLYYKCLKLKNQASSNEKKYFHDAVGFNYRMTNIAASIGLAQLKKANLILKMKKYIFIQYKKKLNQLPLKFQNVNRHNQSSHWMITIILDQPFLNVELMQHLAKFSIETRPLFYPVHTMPPYLENKKYEISENLNERGLSLPSFPDLTEDEISFICEKIENFLLKNISY